MIDNRSLSVPMREPLVIELRENQRLTFREIGVQIGVSTARVNQLYRKATARRSYRETGIYQPRISVGRIGRIDRPRRGRDQSCAFVIDHGSKQLGHEWPERLCGERPSGWLSHYGSFCDTHWRKLRTPSPSECYAQRLGAQAVVRQLLQLLRATASICPTCQGNGYVLEPMHPFGEIAPPGGAESER